MSSAVALLASAPGAAAGKQAEAAVPNSLRASGAAVETHGVIRVTPPSAPAVLINDGSFENGPPPASAWTETTNVACEWIGDWSGVWGAGAYDGSQDFWAGGYCQGAPATSSVSQAGIPVPLSDNNLHFWYMSDRPDADDPGFDDVATVRVNGTPVWTLQLTQANDTFPNWVEVVVPLAAYAGQNVTLEFGAASAGSNTGNIRYDFIQIGEPPPPPSRCPNGYEEVTVLTTQGFEGGFPPAGWVLANSTTGCAGVPGWTNTDPGGRGNLTGATGVFAIADSDDCGSSVSMNAQIWTPQIDLTNLVAPEVSFNYDYNDLGSADSGALDVSIDGGSNWTNVETWTTDDRGPKQFAGAIPGDGEPDVVVRWHYIASWDWWWEIDDVTVTACQPVVACELTLTCPADQVVPAPPGAQSQIVEFADPTVGGDCAAVTTACDPASGDPFDLGTTTVVCTAVDEQTGAQAICDFDVTVGAQTIQEIPTVSRTGLVALVLLLAGAAVLLLRRG